MKTMDNAKLAAEGRQGIWSSALFPQDNPFHETALKVLNSLLEPIWKQTLRMPQVSSMILFMNSVLEWSSMQHYSIL